MENANFTPNGKARYRHHAIEKHKLNQTQQTGQTHTKKRTLISTHTITTLKKHNAQRWYNKHLLQDGFWLEGRIVVGPEKQLRPLARLRCKFCNGREFLHHLLNELFKRILAPRQLSFEERPDAGDAEVGLVGNELLEHNHELIEGAATLAEELVWIGAEPLRLRLLHNSTASQRELPHVAQDLILTTLAK